MPITADINAAARLVVSRCHGRVNESELDELIATLPSRPGFDPAFTHIIDFTEVTEFNLSTPYLQELSLRRPVFLPQARQIVVAPQTHIYGMSRMTQMLRAQQLPNIHVVKTMDEAYLILKDSSD